MHRGRSQGSSPLMPALVYTPCAGERSSDERNSASTAETVTVWLAGVSSHLQEVTKHIKKKRKERERQLVTPSSKYFGMPPAILQRWPRACQTLQLTLTAALGLLSSNINNTCTVSRTDTPPLKDLRITVGLGATKINTFFSARKHGRKQLRKPSPCCCSQCAFQSF